MEIYGGILISAINYNFNQLLPGQLMSLGEVFTGLMKLFLHQNELMWSRIKILLSIEGFALSSGYYLYDKESWLGTAVMYLSIIFIIAIFITFIRDEKYRDQNKDLMLRIGNKIISKENIPGKIDFGLPAYLGCVTGAKIFRLLFMIIIILNLVIANIYLVNLLP